LTNTTQSRSQNGRVRNTPSTSSSRSLKMHIDPVTQLRWATCETLAHDYTSLQANGIRPTPNRLSTSNFDVDFGFLNARLVASTITSEMSYLPGCTPSTDEDSKPDTTDAHEAGHCTENDGGPPTSLGGTQAHDIAERDVHSTRSGVEEPVILHSPPRSHLSVVGNDITALPAMPSRNLMPGIVIFLQNFRRVGKTAAFKSRTRNRTSS
jgi:hypothetical protein